MHALMRYTVKPDHLQTHLDLLRDVYDDLATSQPHGIAWSTYQIADTRSFVELVEVRFPPDRGGISYKE